MISRAPDISQFSFYFVLKMLLEPLVAFKLLCSADTDDYVQAADN